MCVGFGVGGGPAQFLVRVCSKGYFLKKFYQWSYIYLKHLIVKHVFVLVIFEGKCFDNVGPLCRISLDVVPLFIFNFSSSFLILNEWMSEWVLTFALPDFPQKHCTPLLSLKSSMWGVPECKTWIQPLLGFILESGFMNWTISCFCFLGHDSSSDITMCQFYPWLPAFLVLPAMHTC